ncbi:MAG: amidohydrolase family protein [Candidatus Cloacimonetes bacterium]|nr:amidohydrolase family protein [Candidatus Cloacimonadota bacterium]
MKKQILLKNINYLDVENEVIKENVDIFIENDLIKEIKKSTKKNFPDFKIIDCINKYAVPGLFESHAHLCWLTTFENNEKEKILEQFVHKGITQVRDVGGPFDALKKMKEDISSNKMIGPEIFYAGPMLERSPLHWGKFNEKLPGFTVSINTEKDVDTIIQKLQENKASLIKTFNRFDLKIYKYFVKEAEKINLPITHDPGAPLFNSIPMDLAIDLGIKCIEHGKAPWPSVLKDDLQKEHNKLLNSKYKPEEYQALAMKIFSMGIDSISIEKLHKLADKMVQNNVYICPTLTVFNKSEEKDKETTEIVKTLYMMSSFFIKELIKQNVKIIVGIDSCMPDTFQEIKILKNLGLSEIEIIKGATKYPADWLNVYDKYGSIKSNKKANILIVKENPLQSIDNLEKIYMVFKNGNMLYKNE